MMRNLKVAAVFVLSVAMLMGLVQPGKSFYAV